MRNSGEPGLRAAPVSTSGGDRRRAVSRGGRQVWRLLRIPGDARARGPGAYEIPRRGVRHLRKVDMGVTEALLEIAAVIHERCKILRICTPVYADVEAALERLRKACVPVLDRRQPDGAHAVGEQHETDVIEIVSLQVFSYRLQRRVHIKVHTE